MAKEIKAVKGMKNRATVLSLGTTYFWKKTDGIGQ